MSQPSTLNPVDALSGVARDAFDAIEAAAVVGAARRGLLELEQLRTEMPQAGAQIDAGLHDLRLRLIELAARGDGKGVAATRGTEISSTSRRYSPQAIRSDGGAKRERVRAGSQTESFRRQVF